MVSVYLMARRSRVALPPRGMDPDQTGGVARGPGLERRISHGDGTHPSMQLDNTARWT